MKNKKLILFISSFIIIFILLCIAVYFFTDNKKNLQSSDPSTYTITSTENARIEKDEIEAEQIQIFKNDSQVEVITKLKNNSNKTINGYSIDIYVLNKEGKAVTSIVRTSKEKIKANDSIEFTSFITGIDNMETIESAKINSINKY